MQTAAVCMWYAEQVAAAVCCLLSVVCCLSSLRCVDMIAEVVRRRIYQSRSTAHWRLGLSTSSLRFYKHVHACQQDADERLNRTWFSTCLLCTLPTHVQGIHSSLCKVPPRITPRQRTVSSDGIVVEVRQLIVATCIRLLHNCTCVRLRRWTVYHVERIVIQRWKRNRVGRRTRWAYKRT